MKNLYMTASAITSPILHTTTVIETEGADMLSCIIDYDSNEPLGGPQKLVAGTTQLSKREQIEINRKPPMFPVTQASQKATILSEHPELSKHGHRNANSQLH